MKAHIIVIFAALILTQASGFSDKSNLSRQTTKTQRTQTSTVVTTQLTGVVTDPSGAVVPGVEVTLRLADGHTKTTRLAPKVVIDLTELRWELIRCVSLIQDSRG
jgi:hypothetical protein